MYYVLTKIEDVWLCVCVCLYMLCIWYQIVHLTNKARTFLGSKDILGGPHNLERVF